MTPQMSLLFTVCLLILHPRCGSAGLQGMMMNYALDAMGVKDTMDGVKNTVDGMGKSVVDTRKGIVGSFSSASKTVSSNLNSLLWDKIDEHALEAIFAQQMSQTPLEKSSCIEGIKARTAGTGTLTMNKGQLTYSQPIQMQSKIMQEVDDKTVLDKTTFVFPDLALDYSFQFEHEGLIGKDREGKIKIVQSGPTYVNIPANLPKSRSEINYLIKQSTCFLSVQEQMEVVLGPKLTSENVDYGSLLKSTLGFGITEKKVKGIVDEIQAEIQVNVKSALRNLVSQTMRKVNLFCDLSTSNSFNCDNVRDIREDTRK